MCTLLSSHVHHAVANFFLGRGDHVEPQLSPTVFFFSKAHFICLFNLKYVVFGAILQMEKLRLWDEMWLPSLW